MQDTRARIAITILLLCAIRQVSVGIPSVAAAFSSAMRNPDFESAPLASGSSARDNGHAPSATRTVEKIRSVALDHGRWSGDRDVDGLAEAIYRESVAAEVDPLMVTAIVARESSFRSTVVSRTGAVGLMQLRPFVARDLASRGGVEWEGVRTLHRPDQNLRLGILYYREMVERFDGDLHLALAAYNRGPTRVSRELRAGRAVRSRYAENVIEMYRQLSRQVRGA